MKTMTPETSGRRLPLLRCSLCGEPEAPLHLGRWGRYRICPSCHREQIADPSGPERSAQSEQILLIRRVDACFRAGAVVIRLLFYTALYQLARGTDFGPHILSGFLLGDSITWLASAWLERRFHSLAVTIETILYTVAIVVWIQLTGGLQFPEEPAAKALVALSFFGTFSVKGGWQAWRLLHGVTGA